MSLQLHPVHVRLKGHRTLAGHLHVAEGKSLSEFLRSKLHFLNVTDVREEAAAEDTLPHLSIRIEQILWVEPLAHTLPLTSAEVPAEESRKVELQVDDLRLHVQLNVARETRMSDYLDATTAFIPLWAVRIIETGEEVERAALNHRAIQFIRELEATDPRQRARS